MIFFYLIMYIAVFLAAAGQILLKIGSGKDGINLGIIQVNLWIILGLGAMIFSMLLSLRALSVLSLKDMAFILPTIYVLIPLFSKLILKENIGKKTIFGTIILISGVIIFNITMD